MVIAVLEAYGASKSSVPYYKPVKSRVGFSKEGSGELGSAEKNYAEYSDIELVDCFKSDNDELAFNEIFNRYYDQTYRVALKIMADIDEAEDVVQEVFVRLLTGVWNFRGDSKFSTWLYAITLNTIRMRFRELKKNKLILSIDHEPYAELLNNRVSISENRKGLGNPESVNMNRELAEELYKALDTLPEKSKKVFLLRDREQYTNVEVSKQLGISLPAVKSRIHRTRKYLKNSLNPK